MSGTAFSAIGKAIRWFSGRLKPSWGLGLVVANLTLICGTLTWLWLVPIHPQRVLIANLPFVFTILSLTILSLQASRARHLDVATRSGWRLIAFGVLCYLVATIIWFSYDVRGLDPFPSLADLFYLANLPLIFAGILRMTRPFESQAELWLFAIDLGIVSISGLILIWYFLLSAIAHDRQSWDLGLVLSLAYPVGDILLLLALAAWFLRPRPAHSPWPRRWLLSGIAVFLGADLNFLWQEAQNGYAVGGFNDALYHLGALMMMIAAYLDTRPQGQAALRPPARPWSWTLASLPYLAISAVYALVIAAAFGWTPAHRSATDLHQTLVVLILSGSLLTVLSMIRQAIATQEAARLRAQQAIEQHERRFAALARYSSDLILLLDTELRPHFISQSFEQLLGRQPSAAGIVSLFELIHPDDRQRAARLLARALLTQEIPVVAAWRMRHADGDWRDIEMLITNLSHNPAVGGIVLNGRDVTERRRYEQALEKARTEAEAASRAKDLFLANMSHEIRTPLQAILGFIDFLLDSPLAPQQRDYLERIREAGRSLHALLNDILDYSRLQSGRLHLESIPLTIPHVIERCRALFELQARHKGLTLDFTIDPEIPVRLKGDPLRLLQILNNLVGNAIKFTHQGGVWVEVSCLKQTPESALIEFRVRDTGIGLTPRQRRRIFDSFQQADASISRRYGGSGLGLSICKRLVELMDGEIGVESKAGEGSTFWFRVPLELLPPQAEEERVVESLLPRLVVESADPADPQPAPAACTLPPCPEPIQGRLAELAALLEAQNSRARRLSRELLKELQGTPWQAEYEPIAQAIAALDFESARQRLRRLLG